MDNLYLILNLNNVIYVVALDIALIIQHGIRWFRLKTLYYFFPEWKRTKKLIAWYIVWMSLMLLNCGMICLPFVFVSNISAIIIASVTYSYYFILGLIYLIVKYNIRYRYDKKYEKVREARRQAMNEQKHYNDHDSSDPS